MNKFEVFDLLLNNLLRGTGYEPFTRQQNPGYPLDVYVNEEYLVFDIPIVGGSIDDIKVVKTNDELRIEYHRPDDHNPETQWIHRGIARRDFELAWRIGPKWDLHSLHTTFQNGLLKIYVPWAKNARPQEVEILDLNKQLPSGE